MIVKNTSLNIDAQNLYKEAQALFRPFDKEMKRYEYIKTIFIELALYIPRYFQKHTFIQLCLQEISKEPKIGIGTEKLKSYEDKLEQLETLRKIFNLAKQNNISNDLINQESFKVVNLVKQEINLQESFKEVNFLQQEIKNLFKQQINYLQQEINLTKKLIEQHDTGLNKYFNIVTNLTGVTNLVEGMQDCRDDNNYRKGIINIGKGLGKLAVLFTAEFVLLHYYNK